MRDFRDELYSMEEAYTDETTTEYVDSKGKDPDGGPDVENSENVGKVDDVDDVFKDYVTDDDPASQEEMENEGAVEEELATTEEIESEQEPTEGEIDEMTVDSPGTVEEDDVEIDENKETVEVSDDNADTVPTSAETPDSEPIVEPTEENPNGELGIDIDQAVECLIRGMEEEIKVIAGDTEVSIDEAGKVSVDQSDAGAGNVEETETSEPENENTGETESEPVSENTEETDNTEAEENKEENENEDENESSEALDLMKYFNSDLIV